MKFPAKGHSQEELYDALRDFEKQSFMDAAGRKKQLQHVYALYGLPELREITKKAFSIFMASNPSHDTELGVLQMESEVISMLAELWGNSTGVGHITSCGTESNIIALYAARKLAKRKHGSVILASTAHMSLFKGCDYLGLEPIVVPARADSTADPDAMRRAIRKDTIAIAGTAGNWAWAQIDPIEELGKVAEEHSLYFHVDAAYAGLICPWLKEAGYDIPEFTFKVPGVCSIASDPHKQGYCAFPAGALVFRDKEYQKAASYSTPPELGYEYVTPGLIGTRPGYSIAATWAVFNYLGMEGYSKLAKKAMTMTMDFIKGVSKIPGLGPSSIPKYNFATASSQSLDMTEIKRRVKKKGWIFYDQLGEPFTKDNAIVAAILPDREEIYPRFLDDLREIAKTVGQEARKTVK
jgi:tyrosine decarboxylase/aspartate 1-decarboxylase